MSAIEVWDAVKFALPLTGAAIGWIWNEHRRRVAHEYELKERRYAALIDASQGFYEHVPVGQDARGLKTQFLIELNKCWLYCPDDVIRAVYRWLGLLEPGVTSTDEERRCALGQVMLAIRQDLVTRKAVRSTTLTPEEFKLLRAN